jgi:hypothetical protein
MRITVDNPGNGHSFLSLLPNHRRVVADRAPLLPLLKRALNRLAWRD